MEAKLFLLLCITGLAVSRPSEDSWTPTKPLIPTRLHPVNMNAPVEPSKPVIELKPVEEGRGYADSEDDGFFSWLPVAEYRVLSKVYGDCAERKDFTACLKRKALVFLDRASRKRQLDLPGGLVLVRSDQGTTANDVPLTEEQVDATLPREIGQREAQLDDMIVDRSLGFVKTHALRFDFGMDADSQAALDENGRGIKKKDILPYLLLGKLVASSMVAMAFAGLALLAGKALMVSKIALLLSGIVALKKLLNQSHGHNGGGVEVVNVPTSHGHGHYGRSLPDDAHNTAYRGQIQRPSSAH